MTHTSKPIIFFGTEDFSVTALTGLIEAGYPIAAVVTKIDSKKGRGLSLSPPKVKVIATQHNIPVWQPQRLSDIASDIKALAPVAGVLVSFGKIIPQSIIDLFEPGIINVHPSLLPKYRGPSPIESAIANGDNETGVSIMQLTAAMDAGPIYTAKKYTLQGIETQPQLYQDLASLGTELLLENLPQTLSGELAGMPQDDSKASYCHLLQKSDSLLYPSQHTAIEAERLIRAHLSFPRTRIVLAGQAIIITKASVTKQPETLLDLQCKNNTYLHIESLIAPSGRTMTGKAFLNGYAASA
jgi:methionyl-tRNA formyltransferase